MSVDGSAKSSTSRGLNTSRKLYLIGRQLDIRATVRLIDLKTIVKSFSRRFYVSILRSMLAVQVIRENRAIRRPIARLIDKIRIGTPQANTLGGGAGSGLVLDPNHQGRGAVSGYFVNHFWMDASASKLRGVNPMC
jgi:hypothetical protein